MKSEANIKSGRSGLGILLAASILAVILGFWFTNKNFKVTQQQQYWVDHTDVAIGDIDRMVGAAKEAESATRGYLLSGEQSLLDPYMTAKARMWEYFKKLQIETADNPIEVTNSAVLEPILRDRIKLLDEAIEERRRTGKIMRATLDQGHSTMEAITNIVRRMEDEEKRLLANRTLIESTSETYFHFSSMATTALSILVLLLAFARIRRDQMRAANEAAIKEVESWRQSRVGELVQLATEDGSLKNVGRKVLEHFSNYAPVLASNLYWLNGRELRLVASFGTQEDKVPEKLQASGSGLVSEAFKRGEVSSVDGAPAEYFNLASSLGSSPATQVTFVPLMALGRRVGVIELATFEKLEQGTLDYFSALREAVGTSLNSIQSREELQALLDQTQFQAEELQTQQEELRTNNEELEQQARAMEAQKQAIGMRNTELEQARNQLEQKANDLERASQYKSDFLAKMSHELRTPLNSLLILATLLIENKEGNLSERQTEFARSIRSAGNDLLSLINDILDLSKIEARKLAMHAERFTLKHLQESLLATFTPQAEAKKLKFTVDLSPEIEASMYTDRMRLEQILRNFLSNALKFTEQGEINLSVLPGTRPSTICFSVRDSGIGIPASKQNLIFEAFEQADGSVSRKFGGTGLGLTISRELAQLLGGEISLKSEAGKGSTFTLEIPREMAYVEKVEENMPDTAPLPKKSDKVSPAVTIAAQEAVANVDKDAKTILIVEDDHVFRETVASTARGYGFTPVEAAEGEVALEILNRITPSAILLDVKLPGVSGLGVLEIIKRRPELRAVPIHMISAMDYQQNAFRLGAMGYLSKPVTLDNLRAALGRIEGMLSSKVKQLLIVEDDERQRMAICELVQGPDTEIHGVANGHEAVKAMNVKNFDCVILDLALPDLSGFDVIREMNESGKALPPIVIYTAQTLTLEQEEYLRKYSESIIIKGARSPERLLDEVNLFLHRVESRLPQEKRAMLEEMRGHDRSYTGREILVVDDDMRNIFALTSALESKGFQVTIARDGVESLEVIETSLARKKIFDAVLMDLMMPRMDGLEAIRRIRQMGSYKTVPIVALTAKAMKEDQEKCLSAGATDYLPKPIDLKNLFSVLNVWLSRGNLFYD